MRLVCLCKRLDLASLNPHASNLTQTSMAQSLDDQQLCLKTFVKFLSLLSLVIIVTFVFYSNILKTERPILHELLSILELLATLHNMTQVYQNHILCLYLYENFAIK